MDWDKAKNLIILFLLILNAVLLALVIRERAGYYVTREQESAIRSLLARSRVSVATELLRDYRPKKELVMGAYNYDMSVLSGAFFGDRTITVTDEYNKTIYRAGDAALTLQNGYLTYENVTGTGALTLELNEASNMCAEFIEKMGPDFEGFRLDRYVITEMGIKLDYRETFRNELVYSNFIVFNVNGSGIVRIDMMYNKPESYSAQPAREICPSDEALFAFLQRVSGLGDPEEITIDRMDMVYWQDEMGSSQNTSYTASPYYRINIVGADEPFLINAYLNTVR